MMYQISINGSPFRAVPNEKIVQYVSSQAVYGLPVVEMLDATSNSISFKKFVEDELFQFYKKAAADDESLAKTSLLNSESDEIHLGPDLVCGSFAEYQKMAQRVINRYEGGAK